MNQRPSASPRRRRWLIVALLLVLVSGVAWWNWPQRLDKRFVGKWDFWITDRELNYSGDPLPEWVFADQHLGELELRADGSVSDNFSKRPPQTRSVTWRVEGNQLIEAEPLNSLPPLIRVPLLQERAKQLRGQYDVLGVSWSYTVDSVASEVIRLTQNGRGQPVHLELRRIPE